MTERTSELPLTVIQAVAGFPNKKATLFIISTVQKERHSPQNFWCPFKDRALPTVLSGSYPAVGTPPAPCKGCGGGRCVAPCDMAQKGSAQPGHQPGMQHLPSRAVVGITSS